MMFTSVYVSYIRPIHIYIYNVFYAETMKIFPFFKYIHRPLNLQKSIPISTTTFQDSQTFFQNIFEKIFFKYGTAQILASPENDCLAPAPRLVRLYLLIRISILFIPRSPNTSNVGCSPWGSYLCRFFYFQNIFEKSFFQIQLCSNFTFYPNSRVAAAPRPLG